MAGRAGQLEIGRHRTDLDEAISGLLGGGPARRADHHRGGQRRRHKQSAHHSLSPFSFSVDVRTAFRAPL